MTLWTLMQSYSPTWLSTEEATWLSITVLTMLAFAAATVLPLASEPWVLAFAWMHRGEMTLLVLLWLCVSVANTAGGAVNYGLGYGVQQWWHTRHAPHAPPPQSHQDAKLTKQRAWLLRFGPACLVLSWLPLVGDALCVAAGSLRLPWRSCLLYMALGKGLRYALLLAPFLA